MKTFGDDKKIFVNWLRNTIKIDRLMTGRKLAQEVGICPTTISGYLTQRTSGPDIDLRLKMCQVIGVDYATIISEGRETPQSQPPQTKEDVDSAEMVKTLKEIVTNKNEMIADKNELIKMKNDKIKLLENRVAELERSAKGQELEE